MSEEPLQRRTDLAYLIKLADSLREILAVSGLDPGTARDICTQHISAKCVTCGQTIAGDEFSGWLLNFGQDRSETGEAMRFMRIRRGCCGSESCNGRFYDFTFKPHETIDWSALNVGALESTEEAPRTSGAKIATRAMTESLARQFTAKAVAAIALLVLLWLFRHSYVGGEIPVIQPAKIFTSGTNVLMEFQDEPSPR
jgi:hypothetical protein